MTANSQAWKRFFDHTEKLIEIEEKGFCIVSADELRVYGRREPRLMAKLDTLSSRPNIFRVHHLAILPIQNGRYILFKDAAQQAFFQFEDEHFNIVVERYDSKIDLLEFDSYPGSIGLNESQAIDFAHLSSLLSHFTGDKALHLVIRGRQFCKGFEFALSDVRVKVNSVQIEVDAGYETNEALYLIEAKIGKRDDFNIRQLFYPYLEWSGRTQKQVRPIFLTYTNGKYFLTEFEFDEVFGSLGVKKNHCYVINESPRPLISISALMNTTQEGPEPDVPYPQADDLDKVVDLASLVAEGIDTRDAIATFFEFDVRQGDYYANAACYLDFLVRSTQRKFLLTDFGKTFSSTRSIAHRTLILFTKLLERPSFRRSITLWANQGFHISNELREAIIRIISECTELTGTTPRRRTTTLVSWLRWFQQNADLTP